MSSAPVTFAINELPEKGALMGLDLGTKTIGVAISDGLRYTATPLLTIKRTKFGADAKALEAIIADHPVTAIVLGLPLNMDGTEGPRAQSTRAFARNLSARNLLAGNLLAGTPLPIAFWDERLSTSAVTRTLIEADVSRARRAQVVDKLAASYILQGALDFLRNQAARDLKENR
jgi:putative pre-16S rRNA nuclease